MNVVKWIKDATSERNGEAVCPLRVLFIFCVLFYIGMTAYDFIVTPGYHFLEHAKDFAEGIKDMFMGSVAIAAKALTEPKPDA